MTLTKTLTPDQVQELVTTQSALAQARNDLLQAEAEANRVIKALFDAHEVPYNWTADFDAENASLVYYPAASSAAEADDSSQ